MNDSVFYTPAGTDALSYAKQSLIQRGFLFTEKPTDAVTHLLLGVPAFQDDGTLRGGMHLEDILPSISKDITVIGGNLHTPVLSEYKTVDLLQDPLYLAQNANITAHCAVRLALWQLPVTLKGCQVLVVGWGRIGKCLSHLLRSMGAIVTVAARKESDRAMLCALGYETEDISSLNYSLLRYRVIFNTVPQPVLSKDALDFCREDCLKIDLASSKGMDAKDVIWARGLPGKDAPESSGQLIAQTVLRLIL